MGIPEYCEKLLTIHFGELATTLKTLRDWNITESQE